MPANRILSTTTRFGIGRTYCAETGKLIRTYQCAWDEIEYEPICIRKLRTVDLSDLIASHPAPPSSLPPPTSRDNR